MFFNGVVCNDVEHLAYIHQMSVCDEVLYFLHKPILTYSCLKQQTIKLIQDLFSKYTLERAEIHCLGYIPSNQTLP